MADIMECLYFKPRKSTFFHTYFFLLCIIHGNEAILSNNILKYDFKWQVCRLKKC